GAWLMATAKNRALDRLRRGKVAERTHQEIGRDLEARQAMAVADFEATIDDDIGDDLLRLMFTACHPVLSMEARVALTLRPRGAGGPRPGGPDGDPGLACEGARRAVRGAHPPPRAGPHALGSSPRPARAGRPEACGSAGRSPRSLRPASGDRRLPRPGARGGGDGLDAH